MRKGGHFAFWHSPHHSVSGATCSTHCVPALPLRHLCLKSLLNNRNVGGPGMTFCILYLLYFSIQYTWFILRQLLMRHFLPYYIYVNTIVSSFSFSLFLAQTFLFSFFGWGWIPIYLCFISSWLGLIFIREEKGIFYFGWNS